MRNSVYVLQVTHCELLTTGIADLSKVVPPSFGRGLKHIILILL